MIETNTGFLLTRHSYDHYGKAQIELWVSTSNGPAQLIIAENEVVFFIEDNDLETVKLLLKRFEIRYTYKKVLLKTFQQKSVIALYFNSLKSCFEAKAILNDAQVISYENNFKLTERYLMERFVRAGVEFAGLKKQMNGYVRYTYVKIKPCNDYKPKLKVMSLDLECSESGALFSIGFYAKNDNGIEYKKVIMIASEKQRSNEKVYIDWVNDERSLLQALETEIYGFDPDIIIGWNVINFDFRLLYKRALLYDLRLRLGRDKSYFYWKDSRTEKNQGYISIAGRVIIDGIAALKSEAYFFPSFSLEAMAQHFLGESKSVENVENRLEEIIYNFNNNKEKLADYNLKDCILVWDIFEKAKLLDFLIFRSQLTGLEMDRVGGSVAAFTNLYLPQLHRKGYISPNLPEGGGLASPGGYVMNSKPGLYQQVLVLDFKSLYPSIIRTFKIDPLGLIEGMKNNSDSIEGYRGAFFSRENHLLPDIITTLWKQRDEAKKNNDTARSQAIKILMNSFYGVLGSGGCAFYDTRLASSITLRGHAIMQQTAQWIESKGLEVIYGDTDSTFILLDSEVADGEAVSIGKELANYINTEWQLKLARDYQLDSFLEIEFESLFTRFLMPTIRGSELGSKKRYAGLLKKNDGYEVVFKGLENVRTDWTELARGFQKKLYELLFFDADPRDFILKTVKETLAKKRDSELVYKKRLRRPLNSYVKNVPPHVKAARLADTENLKRNKKLRYQNKGWIAYVITVNGPQPVEYVNANIDYQHYIDKQIQPVADAILPFVNLSFDEIVSDQLGLF
ncbi:DNA polymerase II [Aliikangiella sp. IMCC44359]|uniref:DNA polymerase II n=1 Tax=Aliikangiella sp. IMCC44359 TaxID=3459125 RepID=UPI00403A8BE4